MFQTKHDHKLQVAQGPPGLNLWIRQTKKVKRRIMCKVNRLYKGMKGIVRNIRSPRMNEAGTALMHIVRSEHFTQLAEGSQ